jgi:DNA-binding beta-propeller fold protein YncE
MRGIQSPLSLTSTGGTVWVSGRAPYVALYDAHTGTRVQTRPDVGAGAHAITSGLGSIWVLNATTNEVIRINERNGRRAANSPGRLATPGQALVIVAGSGAVWVGVRRAQARDDYILRIDPGGGPRQTIPVAGGVQDLALRAGSLWITNRGAATVTRVSTSTRQIENVIPVGAGPKGIAVDADAAWVAAAGDDALSRIDVDTLKVTTIALRTTPERVAVSANGVWVTSRAAGRLLRIDPRTRRVRENIAIGDDPFSLDVVGSDHVWIGLVKGNAVQRVRFFK